MSSWENHWKVRKANVCVWCVCVCACVCVCVCVILIYLEYIISQFSIKRTNFVVALAIVVFTVALVVDDINDEVDAV